MVLIATPGDPLANAYVDVSGATALLAERLNTDAWDDADSADQETALIWATRLLEEQVRWAGSPVTTTQALGWPRTGITDAQGRPIDSTTIPVTIQRATATYALLLLGDPTAGASGTAPSTVKRKTLGETTIEYFEPGTGAAVPQAVGTTLPLEIRQMLRGWGFVLGGVNVSLLRA